MDSIGFEDFDLDARNYRLRRSGQDVKLERIPLELLLLRIVRERWLHGRKLPKSFGAKESNSISRMRLIQRFGRSASRLATTRHVLGSSRR
jgi:hypothetical protein